MRFSLKFIKEFLDVNISAGKLGSVLTMAGMEVERIEKLKGDWAFDIEVTTNRYDWLSIFGIATEVAAILGKSINVKYPTASKMPLLTRPNIVIEDKEDCSYYIARNIRNITFSDKENKFKQRVINCGLNSVNNIVDITNYCMLKWGNPLHAFDADKIRGDIYIRRANKGEVFIGIDGKERTLSKENLVIADNEKVIALAGIMGAKNTEVDKGTKNILLEGAIFSPLTIRRSRRSVGLDTESSYRFERIVSAEFLEHASAQAASLIGIVGRGQVSGYRACGKKSMSLNKKILINLPQLNSYLGTQVSAKEVKKILERLRFKVKNLSKDKLSVLSPSVRFDIKREVDVYEEFCRIYGYSKISAKIPSLNRNQSKELSKYNGGLSSVKNELGGYIALLGFKEIITYSIENSMALSRTNQKNHITILNPLKKNENVLRTSLLTGMLTVVKHNLNHNQESLALFEIADVYSKNKKGFVESCAISLGLSGQSQDFFRLKASVEEIIKYLNIENLEFIESKVENFTNALKIVIGNKNVGFLGKLDEGKRKEADLKEKVFFAQLDLETLAMLVVDKKHKAFSSYPITWRDISISLNKKVKFKSIEKIVKDQSSYLKRLAVINVYKGKDISKDASAFTLRIFYQSGEKTLTSSEVDSFHNNIRDILSRQAGVVLR